MKPLTPEIFSGINRIENQVKPEKIGFLKVEQLSPLLNIILIILNFFYFFGNPF
jgi:hypothetical protein